MRLSPRRCFVLMLVEVSELRALIFFRPDLEELDQESLRTLADRFSVAILAHPRNVPTWRNRTAGTRVRIVPWSDDFIEPVTGNIRATLDDLNVEPYETLFVCDSEEALDFSVATRVGTALVGSVSGDCLPDLIFDSYDQLAKTDFRPGHRPGYLGEIATTTVGRRQREGSSGRFIRRRLIRSPDITDRVSVIVLGRYFPMRDSRSSKHQPSRRIIEMKWPGNNHWHLFADAVAPMLGLINREHPIDIITRVPPRENLDNLGELIRRSARSSDEDPDNDFVQKVRLQLIRRTRTFRKQHEAGSYENRADNVRGAFAVDNDLAGQHVLLFDDVLTSEHTAAECARVLLGRGAARVTILALGFSQGEITGFPKEVPCENEQCTGHLVMRFNRTDHGAFWGCSEYGNGCRKARSWEDGLRVHNRLNLREDITDWPDVEF